MQQVVTLQSVDEKASGTNKRGPWKLRVFTAAGGTKFQTFDVETGDQLIGQIGSTVEIEYEIEDNGNFQNNTIKGWKPSSETVAVSEPSQPSERDLKQRSKEEVRRTESVKAAATLMASAKYDGDIDLKALATLAESIAVYVEKGLE